MIPSDLVAYARGEAAGPARGRAAAVPSDGPAIVRRSGQVFDAKVGGFVSSSGPAPRPGAASVRREGCLRPFVHVWRRGELRCVCGAASRDPGEAEWDAATEGPP